MSRNQSTRSTGALSLGGMLLVALLTTGALAQEQTPPKYEFFTGYQWLNPGGNVPEPFHPPNAAVAQQLPSMAPGFGLSLTYNVTPVWGIEGDFGHNWKSPAYETTGSVGPRVTWRTDGANMFIHTLLSYNRLGVNGLN